MASAEAQPVWRATRDAKLKRAIDLITTALGLLALAPFFAVIALAILLDDGPPILFRQERVGRYGSRFRILKFRTMCVQLPGQGPLITCAGDPRVTRVGRVLRRCKFDELPQLINVLNG